MVTGEHRAAAAFVETHADQPPSPTLAFQAGTSCQGFGARQQQLGGQRIRPPVCDTWSWVERAERLCVWMWLQGVLHDSREGAGGSVATDMEDVVFPHTVSVLCDPAVVGV